MQNRFGNYQQTYSIHHWTIVILMLILLAARRTIMSWLQIRLYGSDFSSFSTNSYGYYSSNEPKSDHKQPNFRFSPNSPTGC